MEIFKIVYFKLRYMIALGSVLNIFAEMDLVIGATLPCDYTWGERFKLKIEYFKRRSHGIDCTFDDVEKEYLDDWNKKFREAYNDMMKNRQDYDWWI